MTKSLAQAYAERLDKPPCRPMCLAADWRDEPDPRRPKFVRTECGKCGRFIGYRQVDDKQAANISQ
jgi:hypothetical protein